jgi:small membrane protein
MITRLARAVAIDRAKESRREAGPPRKRRPVMLGRKAEARPIELQAKK